MPTLFRLLLFVACIAALVYGGMVAMVTFLHPTPHLIEEPITLPKAPQK